MSGFKLEKNKNFNQNKHLRFTTKVRSRLTNIEQTNRTILRLNKLPRRWYTTITQSKHNVFLYKKRGSTIEIQNLVQPLEKSKQFLGH